MLTDTERAQFNALRDRQDSGETLTGEEAAEVAEFTRRIEEAEAKYLTPATERLRRENEATAARIHALEELIAREERFIGRLNETVRELRNERAYIAAERRKLLAAS